MLRLTLFFTVCVGGALGFACSTAPSGGIGADPTMDGGGVPRLPDGAPILDAAPSPPDYRDPRAADGACNPPNLICGDGGDAGYGGCVAVTVDRDNCGACGNACLGVGAVCTGSQCDCNATSLSYCAGTGCMDITNDTNNCGSCGNVCDPNQFNACINSVCDNM